MPTCTSCGNADVYVGLNVVECSNESCGHFVATIKSSASGTPHSPTRTQVAGQEEAGGYSARAQLAMWLQRLQSEAGYHEPRIAVYRAPYQQQPCCGNRQALMIDPLQFTTEVALLDHVNHQLGSGEFEFQLMDKGMQRNYIRLSVCRVTI